MSPPVFSDISHSGISFQNEGEVNSPLGGTVLLVQTHYIFFRFTCQEIVRPPPHFSAIVHEPRLQNLSKKSIKSLLSETLFHRMRFQIFPPLHAFRGMEMDAVGGQFFSQAIVLHGHGLRHIQIQAFAQCVYASASKRWTSPRCLLGALVNTDSTVAPTA